VEFKKTFRDALSSKLRVLHGSNFVLFQKQSLHFFLKNKVCIGRTGTAAGAVGTVTRGLQGTAAAAWTEACAGRPAAGKESPAVATRPRLA
jgi:hypothetical protein